MINEILSIGFFSGLLCIILLLVNFRSSPLSNTLLIAVILPMTIVQLMLYLYMSGYLQYVPYLYRSNSPLNLVIAPAAFLYVRTIIYDNHKLKKSDGLHFIPAVLHLFQMIPFYLMPISQKKELVAELFKNGDDVVKHQDGGLPPYIQFLLVVLQGGIYIALMYKLIAGYNGHTSEGLQRSGKRWLYTFTALLSAVYLALLINIVFPPPAGMLRMSWFTVTLMTVILLMTNYLFFNPKVLYGLPRMRSIPLPVAGISDFIVQENHYSGNHNPPLYSSPEQSEGVSVKREKELNEPGSYFRETSGPDKDFSYLKDYIPVIENYFLKERPFLNKGYTLTDLSTDIDIPAHHLSAVFNQVYGIRFNDYLNSQRLNFLETNMNNPVYANYTQEGIAWMAGFSSRISFFNAVKKLRNQPAAEFLRQFKTDKSQQF